MSPNGALLCFINCTSTVSYEKVIYNLPPSCCDNGSQVTIPIASAEQLIRLSP